MNRSTGSVSTNIEDGYGCGPQNKIMDFLKVSKGSARGSKSWHERSVKLLGQEIVDKRVSKLDQIIAMQTKSIQTLELKLKTQ